MDTYGRKFAFCPLQRQYSWIKIFHLVHVRANQNTHQISFPDLILSGQIPSVADTRLLPFAQKVWLANVMVGEIMFHLDSV